MKNRIYILTILIGLLSACTSPDGTTHSTTEPDVPERLQYQKTHIDTLFNNSKDKLVVFAKEADKPDLILIRNQNFPDNIETTYNILNDSLGNVLSVSEFPYSQSGDWSIVFTHYFDKEGKTFAFERQTNFFNSMCTEGVAYETRTEFYNSNFQLINKTYKLIDEKNRNLQRDSCNFPYDYEYKVSADVNNYFESHKIKKAW